MWSGVLEFAAKNVKSYYAQELHQEFPTGADSSDEGAKIWFSGCCKCQKSPKTSFIIFQRGASMLRRITIIINLFKFGQKRNSLKLIQFN